MTPAMPLYSTSYCSRLRLACKATPC
jgi:hypothetical protein